MPPAVSGEKREFPDKIMDSLLESSIAYVVGYEMPREVQWQTVS